MGLTNFLAAKPLYYDDIDYTRMPRAYESIKQELRLPPIIHVVGTNGKGTTGRFVSLMLKQSGAKVGHYTSPHLFAFNERMWIDGENISDDTLEALHVKLQKMLSPEFLDTLSYFEYTTFLAAFAFEECDYVVMEAGLGGEYDATNVFPKRLSIITPIGMDHESFLGTSIDAIASTKLNTIHTQAVIAKQYEKVVYEIAKAKANEKKASLLLVEKDANEYEEAIERYCQRWHYPSYFKDNLHTACFAVKTLGVEPCCETLPALDMPGRCQKVAENITVDIGHNPMAASVLANSFLPKSQVLIYNSFADKDFDTILGLLEPAVKSVQLIPIENPGRKIDEAGIIATLEKLALPWRYFDRQLSSKEQYLVFGSFMVAESFFGSMNAR